LVAPAAPGLLSQCPRRAVGAYEKLATEVPSGGSDDPEHDAVTSTMAARTPRPIAGPDACIKLEHSARTERVTICPHGRLVVDVSTVTASLAVADGSFERRPRLLDRYSSLNCSHPSHSPWGAMTSPQCFQSLRFQMASRTRQCPAIMRRGLRLILIIPESAGAMLCQASMAVS
jgi:hypothetical protein